MAEGEDKRVKRISIDLPTDLVDGVDRLRKEWGLRRRGQVFQRLLQVILSKDIDEELIETKQLELNQSKNLTSISVNNVSKNSNEEEKALVIVGNKNIEIKNVSVKNTKSIEGQNNQKDSFSAGIELPGFIRKQTTNLKISLSKDKTVKNMEDTSITTIDIDDLVKAKDAAAKIGNILLK